MELKHGKKYLAKLTKGVLIVPSGIETSDPCSRWSDPAVLIVPSGIETTKARDEENESDSINCT